MSESPSIKLRAIEPEDLDILLEWENNVDLMKFGDAHLPYSRFIMKQYVESAQDDFHKAGQFRYMIHHLKDDRAIGHVDLYDYDRANLRAAVGIVVPKEEDRRHGSALQALKLLEVQAFQLFGLHQIYAFVPAFNRPSQGLFEKAGYSQSGVLKDWKRIGEAYEDVWIYQKRNT